VHPSFRLLEKEGGRGGTEAHIITAITNIPSENESIKKRGIPVCRAERRERKRGPLLHPVALRTLNMRRKREREVRGRRRKR